MEVSFQFSSPGHRKVGEVADLDHLSKCRLQPKQWLICFRDHIVAVKANNALSCQSHPPILKPVTSKLFVLVFFPLLTGEPLDWRKFIEIWPLSCISSSPILCS